MTFRLRRVAGARAGVDSFSGSTHAARSAREAFAPRIVATRAGVTLAAALLFGPGCGGEAGTQTIESSRTVARAGVDLSIPSSSAERFGLQRPGANSPSSSSAKEPGLTYTTPSGWTELAPTSMRMANFRIGNDTRAECYLTLLGGDAGGMASNVNRWRAQMSLPAATASDIDALPTARFLGSEAKLIDLRGTWTGMSGANNAASWRLLGLVLVEPGGSAFLKFTGPEDVLETQREAFLALGSSIHIDSGIDPAAGDLSTALSAAKGGGDPHASNPMPSAHGSMKTTNASAAPQTSSAPNAMSSGAPTSGSGLGWTMPSGWRRAPERTSRLVSFFCGDDDAVECYVTVLPGDAGGALANVNRWRNQLGRDPITEGELARSSKLAMLGGEATLVDFDASPTSEKAGTRLLGTVITSGGQSVFVKLSGPDARVEAQRGAFESFARSLVEAH